MGFCQIQIYLRHTPFKITLNVFVPRVQKRSHSTVWIHFHVMWRVANILTIFLGLRSSTASRWAPCQVTSQTWQVGDVRQMGEVSCKGKRNTLSLALCLPGVGKNPYIWMNLGIYCSSWSVGLYFILYKLLSVDFYFFWTQVCQEFNSTWAWELESKGYPEMSMECKADILKVLLRKELAAIISLLDIYIIYKWFVATSKISVELFSVLLPLECI